MGQILRQFGSSTVITGRSDANPQRHGRVLEMLGDTDHARLCACLQPRYRQRCDVSGRGEGPVADHFLNP
jgi:hypothetical protein